MSSGQQNTDHPASARPRKPRSTERPVLSPLRYPGGKRRLVPYVSEALRLNGLRPKVFAEPFAGGASMALEIASRDLAEQVLLSDLDPLVASFWSVVFEDSEWLCEQVREIEIDLDLWRKLKRRDHTSDRQRALACLVLNRTSFNGSLHDNAGPIGGHAQTSNYKLDCRFPRGRLIARIERCAELAPKVKDVRTTDAITVMRELTADDFAYLDPPFWLHGARLYHRHLDQAGHDRLADAVADLSVPYVLSYDPAAEILAIYKEHNVRTDRVELLYTGSQRTAEEELVMTNLEQLPVNTRLWRTNAEWTVSRANGNGRGPLRNGEH